MRVSVFVDGENIAAGHAQQIWNITRASGTVDFSRIYGDVARLGSWQKVPGVRIIHAGTGKNSADLLLTVQAMDRALSGLCDAILLAGSDADFVHLATHLRERGLVVIGVGEAKTPERYRKACSRFEYVGKRPVDAVPVKACATLTKTDRRVLQILHDEGGDARELHLSQLCNLMRSKHDFSAEALPGRKWRTYLEQRPDQFALRVIGTSVYVRHTHPDRSALADQALQPTVETGKPLGCAKSDEAKTPTSASRGGGSRPT